MELDSSGQDEEETSLLGTGRRGRLWLQCPWELSAGERSTLEVLQGCG